MTKTLNALFLVLFSIALFIGCKEDSYTPAQIETSVYNTLRQQSDLSITLEAIEMAGLQNELRQDNLTFFAPTDSAFKAYLQDLGVDSLSGLYNFYGAATFRNVMLYHLLEKKVKGMDVVNSYILTAATNSNGNNIHAYITRIDKNISLNAFTARVSERDIEVGGSVIHKIDGVLSPLTLNGLIRVNPNFSKLKSAISKSQGNLETILNQENQVHTIFGPDDIAITAFLSGNGFTDWSDFANSNSYNALNNLLQYHIISGETQAQDLKNQTYNTLFTNHWIQIVKEQSGAINIQDEKGSSPAAGLKTTDITAINGTIHVLNKVLEHN
ncbi:secreted/surface protein with fasciclin-like repeats [Owenweeksia hongkongensis DSM 17368]|uniref:Secreted/surface protein with fasciclin-like repeats n=1 Tax=Owenweeksia hongkongensis (strain DSM 17368 / CIP 108786 / JCM 12287 / NRRL B-23963 / UST20020801) TaxID=926562 RepID=G8R7D4_OWEHD|nr:fasciclin domain-containing protein [Owenweeksia hongkongensis]AEV31245.1 secreted/surface protein with fasciclin-like repeats [Owenweeksia hongkongensis DSM 17368]